MGCSNCPAKELINISNDNTNFGCGKLTSYDWMKDMPKGTDESLLAEIRFKNTRKEFFINKNKLALKQGDYVAVTASSGHDVGQITLIGKIAALQYKKKNPRKAPERIIYRKATKIDIEKWHKSRLREKPVMIKARQFVKQLNLQMKISDVEFQADGSKAIFYYIADGRVDFRELIKLYAREFQIRVEMKQIGARQEAAMVGGIGSCGKELCCSSWRTNLDSVSSSASKIQDLPHNIQKLTGQCGKLKCCLMYELDNYLDAKKDFPDVLLELETESGLLYPRKKDLLKKVIWYSSSKSDNSNLIALNLKRVKEIIMLNKKGTKPLVKEESTISKNIMEQEFKSFENNLDILEKPKKKKFKNKKSFKNKK